MGTPGDLISAHAALADINERTDRLRVAMGVVDKLIAEGSKVACDGCERRAHV